MVSSNTPRVGQPDRGNFKATFLIYLISLVALAVFSNNRAFFVGKNIEDTPAQAEQHTKISGLWGVVQKAIDETSTRIRPRRLSSENGVTIEDILQRREEWQNFVELAPPYPEGMFKGRGIVIPAGGPKYMAIAMVTIHVLRRNGCALPIELWYKGPSERPTPKLELELARLDVRCRDLHEYFLGPGYATKTLSLLVSGFREILLLDPDSLPVRDPTFLFEDPMYKGVKAVFWPDFWDRDDTWGSISMNHTMWKIIDRPALDLRTQESGQVLVDKKQCWLPILLTVFLNYKGADFYYEILNGDKDTFRFSWMAVQAPFFMMNYTLGSAGFVSNTCNDRRYVDPECKGFHGHTMVQHDFNGRVLFLHRNLAKWPGNAAVVDSFENYKRTWTTIEEWNNWSRNGSISLIMEYYGIRLFGDVVEKDFLTEIGYDIEKMCYHVLRELKYAPYFREYLQKDEFVCLIC